MKKLIAVLTVLVLMVTAIIPAMAETNGKGGNQPPQSMNSGAPQGQNDKSGEDRGSSGKPEGAGNGEQAPAKPGEAGGGDQNAAAMPEGEPNGGNVPAKPGENTSATTDTENANDNEQDPLQKLVTEGKLSQTTYDAILDYLKSNAPANGAGSQKAPEKPEGDTSEADQTMPEDSEGDTSEAVQTMPEDSEGDTSEADQAAPEKPEGNASQDSSAQTPPAKQQGDMTGAPQGMPGTGIMMIDQATLDAMLADGVITQDEYNVIIDVIEVTEDTPVTEETGSSEGI